MDKYIKYIVIFLNNKQGKLLLHIRISSLGLNSEMFVFKEKHRWD